MKFSAKLLALSAYLIFATNAMTVEEQCCESDELTLELDQLTIEDVQKRRYEKLAQAMPELHRQMIDEGWESKDGFSKLEVIVAGITKAWYASPRQMQMHTDALDRLKDFINSVESPNADAPVLEDPLSGVRRNLIFHVVNLEGKRQVWTKAESFLMTELQKIMPDEVPGFRECFSDALDRAQGESLTTQGEFLDRISRTSDQFSLLTGFMEETAQLTRSFSRHSTGYLGDVQRCLSLIQSQLDLVEED